MREQATEFFCQVCGTHTPSVDGPEYGTLDLLWPVGTPPDAGRYRGHVCKFCFCVTLTFLWQERCHPDDVQSMDE